MSDEQIIKRIEEEVTKELEKKNPYDPQPINSYQKAVAMFVDKHLLAAQFLKVQPLYYDNSKLWWQWNLKLNYWEITDETNILTHIAKHTSADTIKSHEKQEILEALKQCARVNQPQEIPKTWIQFKNKIIDLKTYDEYEASPKYFTTNPIPWELTLNDNTPNLDKLFIEWVGIDYIDTLYEILAYCLLSDYPLHRIFCFIGEGLNGKTSFLSILRKFLGDHNVTSTDLDILLQSRFEKSRLHKKLACLMGETDFNEMANTSVIKQLSGNELTGFEYKNKIPFSSVNYAKIIIATNNLPSTTDKTLGFYRRWLIVDFPNRFNEKKDILDSIPEEEYNNLCLKCIQHLGTLMNKREFTNEGSIETRMKRYEDRSNPFDKFWEDNINDDSPESHIFKRKFKTRLDEWCTENRFRKISDKLVAIKMKERGIKTERVLGDWYTSEGTPQRFNAWVGIRWKEE